MALGRPARPRLLTVRLASPLHDYRANTHVLPDLQTSCLGRALVRRGRSSRNGSAGTVASDKSWLRRPRCSPIATIIPTLLHSLNFQILSRYRTHPVDLSNIMRGVIDASDLRILRVAGTTEGYLATSASPVQREPWASTDKHKVMWLVPASLVQQESGGAPVDAIKGYGKGDKGNKGDAGGKGAKGGTGDKGNKGSKGAPCPPHLAAIAESL